MQFTNVRTRLRVTKYLAITYLAMSIAAVTGAIGDDSWPQFRGPDGQGFSNATSLPSDWTKDDNVLWRTDVPGRGWSSPVVMDEQVWVTTAVETEATEEFRKEKLAEDPFADAKNVLQSVAFHAVAYDLATGEVLHNLRLTQVNEPVPIHSLNSYASPTPVLEPGRLYCYFGTFGTFCVDTHSGEVLWRQQLVQNHSVGPGSSPLLVDGLLILTCDGTQEQFIAALDARDGQLIWRTDRPPMSGDDGEHHKSFSSPVLAGTGPDRQIVVPGAQWVAAYEPQSGEEIWRVLHGNGFSLAPRPITGDGLVYFYSGFAGQGLFAIRTDGRGDVTDTHVEWTQDDVASTRPSPVMVDDRIYIVTERGVAGCIDVASGEVVWRERLGGNYSASLLGTANRIYAFSEEGLVCVFQTGDDFEKLEEHELGERIMASPAVVGETVLLRTEKTLYRFGQRE